MADKFDHLRDYGVSTGPKSVWPIGKPINHSLRIGFIHPSVRYGTARASHFKSKPIFTPLGRLNPRAFRSIVFNENGANPLLLFGVGHNPYAVPPMRGANVGSRYAVPFRVVPDLGQVSENAPHPSAWLLARATKQRCDVLHDDEAGVEARQQDGRFRTRGRCGFHR